MIKNFSDSHDEFIDKMKDNQPIAFIAMFTLVIATFSFDQNPNAKSYAIGAAFLFLTVFIYSIIISVLPKNRIYLRSFFLLQMYIFFIVGISLLFYVMTDYFVVMPDVLKVYSVYPINFMQILLGLKIIHSSEKISQYLFTDFNITTKIKSIFINILHKVVKSFVFASGILVVVISILGVVRQENFYNLFENNETLLVLSIIILFFVFIIHFLVPKELFLKYIKIFFELLDKST